MTANTTDGHGALQDLFAPGPGTAPPHLAGREAALEALSVELRRMQRGKPFKEAVVFGPRGNGKTVLLGRFERQCRDEGADVIALAASQIEDETALSRRLLRRDKATLREADDPALVGGRAGVSLVSGDWEKKPQAERDAYITTFLTDLLVERCAQRSLVATLDEAHTLDAAVGRALLNASQLARRQGASFLLVMAGTPNLESRLNAIEATFWDRAEVVGVGLLPREAAREALEKPLNDHGVKCDEDAMAVVVDESQRYPYFIQVWGEALCRALLDRGGLRIDAGIVDAARPAFEKRRVFYYEKRYNELRNQGLLPQAEVVAGLFKQESAWRPAALEARLMPDPCPDESRALDAVERLSHLGYVWQDYGSRTLEAGIPSLMSYVLAEAAVVAPAPGP